MKNWLTMKKRAFACTWLLLWCQFGGCVASPYARRNLAHNAQDAHGSVHEVAGGTLVGTPMEEERSGALPGSGPISSSVQTPVFGLEMKDFGTPFDPERQDEVISGAHVRSESNFKDGEASLIGKGNQGIIQQKQQENVAPGDNQDKNKREQEDDTFLKTKQIKVAVTQDVNKVTPNVRVASKMATELTQTKNTDTEDKPNLSIDAAHGTVSDVKTESDTSLDELERVLLQLEFGSDINNVESPKDLKGRWRPKRGIFTIITIAALTRILLGIAQTALDRSEGSPKKANFITNIIVTKPT